jgi:hypothetical protein
VRPPAGRPSADPNAERTADTEVGPRSAELALFFRRPRLGQPNLRQQVAQVAPVEEDEKLAVGSQGQVEIGVGYAASHVGS